MPAYNARPTFEEYRYDGLGRRVMTLTDQSWSCGVACVTAETRTVWDGDQILAEIRSPRGSQQDAGPMEEGATLYPRQMGRVLYTHGLGLDKPLLLARMDYDSFFPGTTAIIPHTNWLGNYDSGTFVTQLNGTGPACVKRPRLQQDAENFPSDDPDVTTGTSMDSVSICYRVEWPAEYMHVSKKNRSRGHFGPPSWMGSLVEGGKDASGQMYMRNRFYDPGTGRFTQEDPIGLAGGINLYGFAGGDAVNFSDPYGLSAQGDTTKRGNQSGEYSDSPPERHDRCEVATILRNYTAAVRSRPLDFFRLDRQGFDNTYDFKFDDESIGLSRDLYQVGNKWLRADQFGNFAAGYAGQSAFGAPGWAGVRLIGVVYAAGDDSNEHWSDLESAPMINAGASRAAVDRGLPGTSVNYGVASGYRPPPLTSRAGCN